MSRAGTCLGKIRKTVAEALGLPAGIDVLVGCHDQIAATVGGGAIEQGDVVLGEGSTEALNLLIGTEDISRPRKMRLPIEPYLDSNTMS